MARALARDAFAFVADFDPSCWTTARAIARDRLQSIASMLPGATGPMAC
ncbi:hypothetical protein [Sediminimonas sp.]|nr:hypothetical protein [Sediminimonas sp.]